MAYGALPRNVHLVIKDPERPERRLFVQAKCNNAPDDLSAVAYTMVKATIPSPAGDIETAFPSFEAEPVAVNLGEAMRHNRVDEGRNRPKEPRSRSGCSGIYRPQSIRSHCARFFGLAGDEGFVGEEKIDGEGKMRWTNSAKCLIAQWSLFPNCRRPTMAGRSRPPRTGIGRSGKRSAPHKQPDNLNHQEFPRENGDSW